jgi:uncharacterized membrane protein HdeD (DUF308 family)
MRLEQFPVLLGGLVCLIGIAICFAALQPEAFRRGRERRRRVRAEPNQTGQLFLGAGTICMGAALMGRDTWRFSNIAVLAGLAFLIVGGIMNRDFLKEVLLFRGAARRGGDGDDEKAPPKK